MGLVIVTRCRTISAAVGLCAVATLTSARGSSA